MVVVGTALSLAACANPSDGDRSCADGKCDELPDSEVPSSPCDGIITDMSGRGHAKVAGRNQDPIAKLVLQAGDTCPTSFVDMMAKLQASDGAAIGCPKEQDGGIETYVISETAQALGKPTSYRTVTSRQCGDLFRSGILFSLFGLQAGAPALPAAVEFIAFDQVAGVYNFYESDGDRLRFFGNSKDLLKGSDGEIRRCANCHVSGGLVMKEKQFPWLHWEGAGEITPGAQELVAAHEELGTSELADKFEALVGAGNTRWNNTRIEMWTDDGAVRDLLSPLFCTDEFNIKASASGSSPADGTPAEMTEELHSIDLQALIALDRQFLDRELALRDVNVNAADYDALIRANGQRVMGVPGAIDVVRDHAFVHQADIQTMYVRTLAGAKSPFNESRPFVDADFINDVLMIDFTRPVFSTDRCDLLQFAPKIAGTITPAAIRAGFIANLEAAEPAATSPAGILLANLKNPNDTTEHGNKAAAFLAACQALGSRRFLENELAITSLNRNKARQHKVMEFPETLPIDDQNVHPDARLHPKTCELVNQFVAP